MASITREERLAAVKAAYLKRALKHLKMTSGKHSMIIQNSVLNISEISEQSTIISPRVFLFAKIPYLSGNNAALICWFSREIDGFYFVWTSLEEVEKVICANGSLVTKILGHAKEAKSETSCMDTTSKQNTQSSTWRDTTISNGILGDSWKTSKMVGFKRQNTMEACGSSKVRKF